MNKTHTNMERIIAKIDNDFNPDNSDWIPRVIAWTIDAMSILKVNVEEVKVQRVDVNDRIAYFKCGLSDNIIAIYDENGCPIKEKAAIGCECSSSFTGEGKGTDLIELSNTTATEANPRINQDISIAIETTKGSEPMSHRVINIKYENSNKERNYVIIDNNKIELNFDTKCITVKYKDIKTCNSELFGCSVPVVPNNGLLIECIVAWCMYKMLCRGYRHPVFNLRDNSPAINPFIFWIQNKDKAKDSVNLSEQGDIDSNLWRSAFYINTFDPLR